MNKKIAWLVAGLLVPSFAFAHPGHADGFIAAFAHPFSGIDHLLMMLFVGVWAGRIGGAARWQLPAMFIAAMSVGFLLASNGAKMIGIDSILDSGIAAGIIALGLLLTIGSTLPRAMQWLFVAAFALLHGVAHGVELNGAQTSATIGGFIAATALLHGIGILLAQRWSNQRPMLYRITGLALSAIGGGSLFS